MKIRLLVALATLTLPLPIMAATLGSDGKPITTDPAYEASTDDPVVVDAAQGLLAFISTPELAGNGSVVYVRDPARIRLFWPGDLPAAVTARVEEIRRAGVTVEVLPAPHAAAELDEEGARLRSLDPTRIGFTITSVGPLGDLSGMHVGVLPGDLEKARAFFAEGRFHYEISERAPTAAGSTPSS